MSFLQGPAGRLADSVLLRRGRNLYEAYQRNINLPVSKFGKLQAGSWVILADYAKGTFPPKFHDQQKAYRAEINYRFAIPGSSPEEVSRAGMTKPFSFGEHGRKYVYDFCRIWADLERAGLRPPAKILELGCGSGWMAEFLAWIGFDVCGTTLSEHEIVDANKRIQSLKDKGLSPNLRYLAAPMESVHKQLKGEPFDAVFVYEALHHAFDWRESIQSAYACLKPGGWLLICNEPNFLHTFISYRVAKLTNTHEIGFSKGELIGELRRSGFQKIISSGPALHFWVRPFWLQAQKQRG